jgi:hypothetical protein
MPFTLDSKLGDLLKDPRVVQILDKYMPGASKHPMLALGKGMPLKVILATPQAAQFGFTKEKVDAILEEANKLG